MSIRNVLSLALFAVGAASLSSGAMAATTWQKDHPRRAEVNGRLANQDARIHNEVKTGQISKTQAVALHSQDRQVRTEERAMAAQNGGHITRTEKGALNQQETGISHEIAK